MKLIRYSNPNRSSVSWGIFENGNYYHLHGDPLGDSSVGQPLAPDIRLMAPCAPSKVIAAAINYYGATDWEPGMTEPLFFMKSPTSVIGPNEAIVSPFPKTWGEAELAIVIGRRTKCATLNEATKAILGYTIANDVSSENTGIRDHHLLRSKAADTFCPLGPYIDTEYSPENKEVRAIQNGETLRLGNTRDLFWDPVTLVSRLSHWVTLEPWDIILTGSPPMTTELTFLKPGDQFEAHVEGFPPLRSSFSSREVLFEQPSQPLRSPL